MVAMSIEEVMVVMVLVVREFIDVFPNDLPGLPHDREIEFGIDVSPVPLRYSKHRTGWHR